MYALPHRCCPAFAIVLTVAQDFNLLQLQVPENTSTPSPWGTSSLSPCRRSHQRAITHADWLRSKEKTHINVVVIGHVDSGKSTTTGRKLPFTYLAPQGNIAYMFIRLDLQVRRY